MFGISQRRVVRLPTLASEFVSRSRFESRLSRRLRRDTHEESIRILVSTFFVPCFVRTHTHTLSHVRFRDHDRRVHRGGFGVHVLRVRVHVPTHATSRQRLARRRSRLGYRILQTRSVRRCVRVFRRVRHGVLGRRVVRRRNVVDRRSRTRRVSRKHAPVPTNRTRHVRWVHGRVLVSFQIRGVSLLGFVVHDVVFRESVHHRAESQTTRTTDSSLTHVPSRRARRRCGGVLLGRRVVVVRRTRMDRDRFRIDTVFRGRRRVVLVLEQSFDSRCRGARRDSVGLGHDAYRSRDVRVRRHLAFPKVLSKSLSHKRVSRVSIPSRAFGEIGRVPFRGRRIRIFFLVETRSRFVFARYGVVHRGIHVHGERFVGMDETDRKFKEKIEYVSTTYGDADLVRFLEETRRTEHDLRKRVQELCMIVGNDKKVPFEDPIEIHALHNTKKRCKD